MMRMGKSFFKKWRFNPSRRERQGFFISFEGGEGTGKSTQMALLAAHLREKGREVVVTREPGGTKGAEAVRHVLLSGAAETYGTLMEVLLFAAARADHVDEVIAPALQAGKIVLCDRFIDSTRVYQGGAGYDGCVSSSAIALFEQAAIRGIKPDLTFILDVPASIGLSRARKRRPGDEAEDRFEREALEIHEKRRQIFLAIAAQEKHRCIVINAAREVTVIARDIALLIEKRMR